jgi:hypothetical protein
MPHDRIHARQPTHDGDRWRTGTVEDLFERDGHAVVVVRGDAGSDEGGGGDRENGSTRENEGDGDRVELTVTLAVRDLFVRRLDLDPDESPVGSRAWYRKRGRG